MGLSETQPRSEGRLKALLWPSIQNSTDLEYLSVQGFWVCFLVGCMTFAGSLLTGSGLAGLFEFLFFFLAAAGVSQRSRFAALTAFIVYLASAFLVPGAGGFSVVRLAFLAVLLSNVRGTWAAAKWARQPTAEPPLLPEERAARKFFSERLPAKVWPVGRYVFYLMAGVELLGLLVLILSRWIPLPVDPSAKRG